MRKLSIFKYKHVSEDTIQSGFTELDKITCGWKNGELIVIGRTSGNGKNGIRIVDDKKYRYS